MSILDDKVVDDNKKAEEVVIIPSGTTTPPAVPSAPMTNVSDFNSNPSTTGGSGATAFTNPNEGDNREDYQQLLNRDVDPTANLFTPEEEARFNAETLDPAPLPLEGTTETTLPPMDKPIDRITPQADPAAQGEYDIVFRKDRDTLIPVALLDVVESESEEGNVLDLKLVTGETFLKVSPSVTGREEGKWSIRKDKLPIKIEEYGEIWQSVVAGYDSLKATIEEDRKAKVAARREALEAELALLDNG